MQVLSFKVNEIQADALKEVANIGIGNATSALSEMLDRVILVTVPRLGIVPVERVMDQVGGAERPVAGVCLSVEGDINGHVAFVFEMEQAQYLIELLTGQTPSAEPMFDDLGQSALMEVGNILASAYINALTEMTNLSLRPSPPAFACDMAGAVATGILLEIGQVVENALVITVALLDENMVDGFFFFVPEPESLAVLLNALGVGE